MDTTTPRRSTTGRTIAIALGAVAAVVVAIVGVSSRQGSEVPAAQPSPSPSAQAAPQETTSPLLDLPRRQDGDALAIGSVDAPVDMIEYADFTCTCCSAFAVQTLPDIVERHVDAGTLRIEWHHAPVLSEDSTLTAIGTQTAVQQGRFWEYADLLYQRTFAGDATWDRQVLLDLAGQIDALDAAAFEATLDDPAAAAVVQQHAAEAQQLGVTGTPTFVIGSQVVNGAQPIAAFDEVIAAEAAATAAR